MNRFHYLLLFFLFSFSLSAQFPTISLDSIKGGFSSIVAMANAGDGSNRLFIVERAGRIKVYDLNTNTTVSGNFLSFPNRVLAGGERGLLGLAFHPDYGTNGKFYVNFTVENDGSLPNGTSVISEFTNNNPADNDAEESTERVILTYSQPYSNHNAGDLAFGPDGMLWIPTGDGGSGGDPQNRAQNTNSLLGKMLRIDVDNPDPGMNYGIPADNPFVNDANYRPEIWGLGLRNPWRFAIDGNAMWIADVGQGNREEVNYIPDLTAVSGLNWGWRCYEGTEEFNTSGCQPANSYVMPDFEYPHTFATGGFSITGGEVYRGSQTSLTGMYLCADYLSSNLWLLQPTGNGSAVTSDRQRPREGLRASTFGLDEAGEMYVADLDNGSFFRIVADPALPVDLTAWTATYRHELDAVALDWTTAREENSDYFQLERATETDGDFRPIARLEAKGNSTVSVDYNYLDRRPVNGPNYYRLRQFDLDGTSTLSPVRSVLADASTVTAEPRISPNPLGDEALNIWLPAHFRGGRDLRLDICDLSGKVLLSREFYAVEAPELTVDLGPELPRGAYLLRLHAGGNLFSTKLVR